MGDLGKLSPSKINQGSLKIKQESYLLKLINLTN